MLEVRVSPEEKAAFLDACREFGRSASAVIRDAMRAYASFGPMARLPGGPMMFLSTFSGVVLGGAALFLALQFGDHRPQDRLEFGLSEFERRDSNGDNRLQRTEFIAEPVKIRAVLAGDGWHLPGRTTLYSDIVGGVLMPWGLDPARFHDAPEAIPELCLGAVEEIYRRQAQARFELLDLNRDGEIGVQEFRAVELDETLRVFQEMDRNNDGRLDEADSAGFAGPRDAPLAIGSRSTLPTYFSWHLSDRCNDLRSDSDEQLSETFQTTSISAIPGGTKRITITMSSPVVDAQARARDLDGDGAIRFGEYANSER
jgi:hypothetical protein